MAAPLPQRQLPAALEIDYTKSTRHPNDPADSMLPHETHCQRKRRRDQSACEEVEERPSAKRRKAALHNYSPEFWNDLSKITLTRRALKEFDRRTAKEKTVPIVGVVKRPARLLRSDTKQLKRLANNGGPNLNHLRGYAEIPQAAASMSKSSSRKGKRTRDSGLPSSESMAKTSTTGPYNSQFQQMLTDRGVFPDGYRGIDRSRPPKPNNLDELRQMLPRERSSLSPSAFSEGAFEEFQDMNRIAKSEAKAMSSIIPIITGVKDRYCKTEENTLFNNVEKFAPDLKMAQPDKYYGARPEQVDERVRCDLGQYIIPSTSKSLPVAPNFFFEGKSAAGRPDVAQRQVMHDNAIGARAMFELQNYRKETPVYDGNAYTIGSSYSDGQLKLYSTHPRQSATGGTEYHMTQLDTYGMTGNIETFRRGAAAYRNSRDFTQEQRDQLITKANAVARSSSKHVSSSNNTNSTTCTSFAMATVSFGSDTSTDELALHYDQASDESGGKARPRKRVTQTASTGPHLHPSTRVHVSNMQASNRTTLRNRGQTQDGKTDYSNSDDEQYVTADGEQDEDEDEDEDEVHTALHGRAIPDEATLTSQRSQSAQNATARLLQQGHSKEAALN